MSDWSDAARVIDVSHWQVPGDLDWKAAAAAGCVGAIIKFTQGIGGVDPAAREHSWNAYKADIPLLGGYHFGDGSDPAAQAKHFLDTMRADYGPDLSGRLVMLDAEQNKPQMTVAQAEVFVTAVHDAIGRSPVLYMGHFGPTGNGAGLPSAILSNCPLMLPAYGNHANNLAQYLPKGWRMPKDGADRGESGVGVVRLWQFTDGAVNGGPFTGLGKVDQSRLIGFASVDEAQAALAS